MNARIKLLSLVILLACVCSYDQSRVQSQAPQPVGSRVTDAANIFGVWRGQMDGLPVVTLVVSDEGGSLSGAVLFYLHMRKTVNDPYTSTPGLPEPMFRLRFDGKTLEFDVSHRRAHPPQTLNDSPVAFRLTLTRPNQAELLNQNEGGPRVVVVRSDY
jgi:hypothetical protein